MEEEDTRQCPNCKREIPSINFTTHSVHCARNLRNCPVCKEPVPLAQLQEHHDALHKEVPCKKCGESVCGTDLEDHIRDSCAQTIKPCKYCELELPRHALPAHEAYCGARSEQCPDCREYVMIKYRQLHLDSNHGFLRLSDDPPPIVVKAKPKPSTNGYSNPSTSLPQNGLRDLRANRPQNGLSDLRPQTDIHSAGTSNQDRLSNIANGAKNVDGRNTRGLGSINDNRVSTNDNRVSTNDNRVSINDNRVPSGSGVDNRVERNGKVTMKRTNDQPQINTSVEAKEKVHKELPSRGAVKKRQAPPPPDPLRDLPYWSAQKRAQDEERRRQEQTAYNLSVGLPPVLSPAAKLERLRKMDALHNREVDEDRSRGQRGRTEQERLDDLSHLRPMTTQQFMDRFQELQLGAGRRTVGAGAAAGCCGADRFSEIKSSLRELRRGLNEVTAPYNSASNATNNTNDSRVSPPSPAADTGAAGDLRLPCEFCGVPIPADDLVLHQTGCRPDLTQFRPKTSRPRSPRPPRARTASGMDDPVIPCEFCTESLPVYLISEHQERCRRDANTLYPD